MKRTLPFVPVALVTVLACGSSSEQPSPPDAAVAPDGRPIFVDAAPVVDPVVDLRADVNRDGVVDLDDPGDDEGEEGWSATAGAIFLANIDDDLERCPEEMFPALTPDEQLAACHDGLDEEVNGADDLLDLARLRVRPWPEAPAGATGTLTITPGAARARVRLFRRTANGFAALPAGASLTADELRAGIELGIEARDLVRDLTVWDGLADVTLTIGGVSDTVRLRVSPLILSHHVSPAQRIFATDLIALGGAIEEEAASAAFREELRAAGTAAGVPEPLFEHRMRDRWMQDLFETGYMSMPSAGGGQHVMRVALRTPEVRDPEGPVPLRVEGRIVFFLRGKDVAALQQFEHGLPAPMRTLNSFGNTETIPPHGDYPLGRLLRGNVPSFHPDPSVTRLLEAQRVQPPLYVDTSWLFVAHVDETLAFVPASTPRGWVMLANDPALARAMLQQAEEEGHGDTKLFTGRTFRTGAPAETTVSQVLADVDVMTQSSLAAAEIDAQIAIVKEATGLGDDEIIRVPYLHEPTAGRSVAYQPGTVNLLVLSRSVVVAPDPHGPMIGGKDIFKAQLEEELGKQGITVRWADTWDLLHRHAGEVHCGTNATRAIPDARWWESGR